MGAWEAGGQPGEMVPQLASVLTRRHRGHDRAQKSMLPIDRDRWHAEGAHPLDPVLMLGEDAVIQARLDCRGSTPGRIEPRLGQGLCKDRRIGERCLPFVTGATKGMGSGS